MSDLYQKAYVEFKRKVVLASKDLLHFEQNDEFVKANDLKIASSLLKVIIEWPTSVQWSLTKNSQKR